MISPADAVLLRLRATDVGFHVEHPASGDWLSFAAAGNQAMLWLGMSPDRGFIAAAGPATVAQEVGAPAGTLPWTTDLPDGAAAAWACPREETLDALCRRIAVLGHVLPSQPLLRFEAQVAQALAAEPNASGPGPDPPGAPRDTERLAAVRLRVGQQLFREALLSYWGGRCPISGITHPSLLRASHAKPWAAATDAERLDVHNGLLLAAHLDAAFDAGLITVRGTGEIVVAPELGETEQRALGITGPPSVLPVTAAHVPYLVWHAQHVFRSSVDRRP